MAEEETQNYTISPRTKATQTPERAPASLQHSNATKKTASSSPYAYAFLIAGVNPSQNENYKGYFYNVLVSASILREHGSQADICLMIQMTDTFITELPADDTRLAEALGVTIIYLGDDDETATEQDISFDDAVFYKFHIFQWTHYRRVFFLDADITPLCNLDYIFHGSEDTTNSSSPLWRENLLIPGPKVPAGAGNFMIEPQPGDWELLQATINQQKERAKMLPYPHFNVSVGWGFDFQQRKKIWRDYIGRKYSKWDFYGAQIDQGLLYYFVRFLKGNYSIAFLRKSGVPVVESYSQRGDQITQRMVIHDEDKINDNNNNKVNRHLVSCLPQTTENPRRRRYTRHPWYQDSFAKFPFHSDFLHFYAKSKPWNQAPPKNHISKKHQAKDGVEYWFYVLRQLDQKHSMNIDWDNFYEFQDTSKEISKRGETNVDNGPISSNGTSAVQVYKANDAYWAKFAHPTGNAVTQ